MQRVHFIGLGLGLALGAALAACNTQPLDELLLDAWCDDADDCAPGQTCFPTPYQSQAGAQGWCRNSALCSVGAQPGCDCEVGGDGSYSCTNPTGSSLATSSDAPGCQCWYRCSTADFGEDGCPGALTPTTPENLNDSSCLCQPAAQ